MSTTNEQERTRAHALAEKLRKSLGELSAELIERNIDSVAMELLTAADATGGIAMKFGFAIIGETVSVDGKISWSRKFADVEETVFRFANPNEPALPGLDKDDETKVTIRSGGGEIFTTAGAIKRAGRKVKSQKEEEAE